MSEAIYERWPDRDQRKADRTWIPGFCAERCHADADFMRSYNPGLPVDQLLKYSDSGGNTNGTYSSTYRFGPYLRSPFPSNPRNQLSTVYVKATPAVADPAANTYGWVAVLSHGYFGVHLTVADLDDMGIKDAKQQDEVRGIPVAQ